MLRLLGLALVSVSLIAGCSTNSVNLKQSFDGNILDNSVEYDGSVLSSPGENPLYAGANYKPCKYSEAEGCSSVVLQSRSSGVYLEIVYVEESVGKNRYDELYSEFCMMNEGASFRGIHDGLSVITKVASGVSAISVSKCIYDERKLWLLLANSTQVVTDESVVLESVLSESNRAIKSMKFNAS